MYTRYSKNFINTHPFSTLNLVAQLATGVALTWTVPGVAGQKFRVKFRSSFTAEIWVAYNQTAVAATAATATTIRNQEMLPLDECRYVIGGDTLSFYAGSGTPQVSAQLLLVEDTSNL